MNFFLNWLRGDEDEGDFIPRPAAIQGELAASFKITAKDFGKFDGMPEHWFSFKNKTKSTLGIAGFSSLLDPNVPIRDIEGNHRLYFLFEGATNEGAASHIVKRHKETMDGRAAWQSLVDWFEGVAVAGDIAKTCRTKLQALELNPKGNTNTYINEFIRLRDQLEDTGEGERPATLIDQFLDHIRDDKYRITVSNLRMDRNKTLDSCIEAIRQQDLINEREEVQDRRLKARRLNADEDVTSNQSGSQSTYIPPEVWSALTGEQRKAIIDARKPGAKQQTAAQSTAKARRAKAKREKAKAKQAAKGGKDQSGEEK